MWAFLGVGLGGAIGSWLRWWLGSQMNHFFPSLPLGTLTANVVGGFLIGLVMGFTRNHGYFSETVRLSVTTGFLGGLTTFSAFSAETVTLLAHYEYLWASCLIISHVAGAIAATVSGFYVMKMLSGW